MEELHLCGGQLLFSGCESVIYTFVVYLCVYRRACVHTLCTCAGLSTSNSAGRSSAQLRPGRRASGNQQDKVETTMKVDGLLTVGICEPA